MTPGVCSVLKGRALVCVHSPYPARAQGKAERIVGSMSTSMPTKLEEQVAAQVQFQQVLMDTIPVPIFYKDAQGRYLGFNRAYEQTFGIRREDYLGLTVQSVMHLSQDARDD